MSVEFEVFIFVASHEVYSLQVIMLLSLDEIMLAFRRFGPLVVDWPHKAESKSYFPPKGKCEYYVAIFMVFPSTGCV